MTKFIKIVGKSAIQYIQVSHITKLEIIQPLRLTDIYKINIHINSLSGVQTQLFGFGFGSFDNKMIDSGYEFKTIDDATKWIDSNITMHTALHSESITLRTPATTHP